MKIEVGNLGCDFVPWQKRYGQVLQAPFALDIETPIIVGYEVPQYILGAAYDEQRGFFLPPDTVHDFLLAHWDLQPIFHNCAFDLAVLDAHFKAQGKTTDIYCLTDGRKVWDTMVLHKLYGIATLGHAHQGKGQSTLEQCAQLYLNVTLAKDVRDCAGDDVRLSWGKWRGRPLAEITPIYLEYLGKDVLCTYSIFKFLHSAIQDLGEKAHSAWGFVDYPWLEQQWQRFGPLTHDLQVGGLIALEEIERVGFGLDLGNRNDILAQVTQLQVELREELRAFGYRDGEEGSGKALQALIARAVQEHPDIEIPRTPSGKFSAKEEDLDALAPVSEFFARYKEFTQVNRLLNSYLKKMDVARIHSHYDFLKNSGRTCSSNPNIQGFPKKGKKQQYDIRRCFVPAAGKIFYVVDYASVELRTLAQLLLTQFGLDSAMAKAINAGKNLHKLVAAVMKITHWPNAAQILAEEDQLAAVMKEITDDEKNGAKPANFGLPVGMGIPKLKAYASAQFGLRYTDEEAMRVKEAWFAAFPEMKQFLQDSVDIGLLLAEELNLTPRAYAAATGERIYCPDWEQDKPSPWYGRMAFKVLKEESPVTAKGMAYTSAMLDYFWSSMQGLAPRLERKAREALLARVPSKELSFAVRKLIDRVSAFTNTGRLRARASYSARRNTAFQGTAADGAKIALYWLWRAGFRVVAFIHDEVVIEVDETDDLATTKKLIDDILIGAMKDICPDIAIEVEGTFRRCWGKDKADEIEIPQAEDHSHVTV